MWCISLFKQIFLILLWQNFIKLNDCSINFLAIGDWGGQQASPYSTSAQRQSNIGMNIIASQIQSEFVLALGDNFYSVGISSDVNDHRFDDTFESVYMGTHLQTPWYIIAGNHDHLGNVTAQIEYSLQSNRWTFPQLFYTKSFKSSVDGVTLDLIMIDTIVIESSAAMVDNLPVWDWLEQSMSNSTADFILVGGHYPVYSVCEHGSTPYLIDRLKPLLEKYEAHYISGHDHCMEHIREEGSRVNQIITGMGKECCYKSTNMNSIPMHSLKWYIAHDNHNYHHHHNDYYNDHKDYHDDNHDNTINDNINSNHNNDNHNYNYHNNNYDINNNHDSNYDNNNNNNINHNDAMNNRLLNNIATATVRAGFTAITITSADGLTATFYDQDGSLLYVTPAISSRNTHDQHHQNNNNNNKSMHMNSTTTLIVLIVVPVVVVCALLLLIVMGISKYSSSSCWMRKKKQNVIEAISSSSCDDDDDVCFITTTQNQQQQQQQKDISQSLLLAVE